MKAQSKVHGELHALRLRQYIQPKEKIMQCFMCDKPVIPEGGYFKTQLFNGKHICHVGCRPHFHYDNKPEEDLSQADLFKKGVAHEETTQSGHT